MIMGLTTPSCRLGGTISARMKRWRLSGSIAGYVIGLPAFALCGVESARGRHHRTVCRLSRQSNSDKTHLATGCLIPSDFFVRTGRPSGGSYYNALDESLRRLKSTTIRTNIEIDDTVGGQRGEVGAF